MVTSVKFHERIVLTEDDRGAACLEAIVVVLEVLLKRRCTYYQLTRYTSKIQFTKYDYDQGGTRGKGLLDAQLEPYDLTSLQGSR